MPVGTSRVIAQSIEYQPIPGSTPEPQAPAGPTTRAEMEAFVDGFMAAQLISGMVAGATVSVVKDGALFFAKGYGYADVEKHTPVCAARTLFRPGSISKLFTWIAVMQLVEAGQLDLDTDVNVYLKDLKLPATHPDPITLRNLMTHTPGLEDGMTGFLFAASERNLLPLGAWLEKHKPTRVRPPTRDFSVGTNAAYSNWGVALAGHIVATVSGISYDDYIDQRILSPLEMRRSTFREPLPGALAGDLSCGYAFESRRLIRKEFEFIHPVGPAGSLSATAADIGQFMLALLHGGALNGRRILSTQSVGSMLARTMSPDPALNGSTLGFYETWINGRRVVGHAGHTNYFHSNLSLLPEASLGLFVSVNTAGQGEDIPRALEKAFVRHYFPADLPQIIPPKDAVQRNARYRGTYRPLRRSHTTWEKFLAAKQDVCVRPMPDGTMYFPDPAYAKPAHWTEVGDGVFRRNDDDVFVAFKSHGPDAKQADFLMGPFPPIAAQRIRWYETGRSYNLIAAATAVIFALQLITEIYRWWAGHVAPPELRWAGAVLAAAGVLLLIFIIGLRRVISSNELTLSNIPIALYLVLTLPLLASPLVICAIFYAANAWLHGELSLAARLQYTVTTGAAVVLYLQLKYWNLLGLRLD